MFPALERQKYMTKPYIPPARPCNCSLFVLLCSGRGEAVCRAEISKEKSMGEPRQFENAQEAVDRGFEEGNQDRRYGGKSDKIKDIREQWELGFKWARGQGAPFYKNWRLGYDAGYLGYEKPSAT
jgi:hypothetical protein